MQPRRTSIFHSYLRTSDVSSLCQSLFGIPGILSRMEGIVAKRKLGIYKDDATGWLKVKNRTYSQAERRHELLTRGR